MQCPKLTKKRTKEGIVVPYLSLKEELEGVRRGKPEVMEVEMELEDERVSEGEDLGWEEEEPVFKVINNLTFLVEEL